MKVLLITGRPRGLASIALPLIARSFPREDLLVILDRGARYRRLSALRRAVRKTRRIGVLGALNGVRMRRWYGADLVSKLGIRDIREVAAQLGVDLHVVPGVGSPETERLIVRFGAEVGISLGNGYIPHWIFQLPRLGMVNVHHELLPELRGAQSVIWQIFNRSSYTGFTIHEIDRGIDSGRIIAREQMEIRFQPSLRGTVVETLAELFLRSAEALAELLPNIEKEISTAVVQHEGTTYTTPSIREYLQIRRNHQSLYADSLTWSARRGS